MTVKIGYQSYGWYHFRETHQIDLPLSRILLEIKHAGFNHVELCSPTEELGTPAALKSMLEELGLTLHALTGRIDGGLIAWSKERIDFLREIGGEVLVVNAGWISPGEEKTEDRYRALADGLEELAQYGRPRRVAVAYHNHLGTIVETPREIDKLLSLTRSAAYCIDTGHLAAAGGDVLDVIQKHADRIAYGHLKDVRVNPATGAFEEFVELTTGNAGVDTSAIVAALESQGFDGWLMVEQDHTHTTPADSAQKNAHALRRLGIPIA
ncbi:MAG: TIM barrel protein [Planctomycetes bacterium]|nr:TIM barrel protein [Planctomycetota bacterium]